MTPLERPRSPREEDDMPPDVHVVPQGDKWTLTIEGQGEGEGSFDTQQEAIDRGRELAQKLQGELIIHGEDGSIRAKDSHGNDPRDVAG